MTPDNEATTNQAGAESAGAGTWTAVLEETPFLSPEDLPAEAGATEVRKLTASDIGALIDAIPTDLEPGQLDEQLWIAFDAIARIGPGAAGNDLKRRIEQRFNIPASTAGQMLAAARRSVREAEAADAKQRAQDEREPTDAERIVMLAEHCELFHEPGADGECYADVPAGEGGRLTYKIRSSLFRQWLAARFYSETGRGASDEAMQIGLNTIEAKARHAGAEHQVLIRVGWVDAGTDAARCYLDLGTSAGTAIEIDANGWRVVALPAVRFRRSKGLLPLPQPEAGGTLEEVFEVVNVRAEERVLVMAWLVMLLHWRGAYTVLVLRGEQGSGKSSTAGMLKQLLDPGKAGLRATPKDTRDLAIAASAAWVLAFDNLSHLPADLSDALCRLATPGTGGFALRSLYTNDEEVLFEATRPILINGIGDGLVGRSDLADRAIQVECPVIGEGDRRTDDEVKARFAELHPRLLGAVCDAVAIAIRGLKHVRLDSKSRMADFEVWSCAAEPAFGCEPGGFLAAYRANRAATHDVILQTSPVAVAVLDLIAKHGHAWRGTPTELHRDLSEVLDDAGRRAFPKTPKALSDALKRLAPNLRAKGIEASQGRGHGGVRVWYLGHVCVSSASPKGGNSASPASPHDGNRHADTLFAVTQRVTKGDAAVTHGDAGRQDDDEVEGAA